METPPEGWSHDSRHIKFMPFEDFGLPPAKILFCKNDLYFAECGKKYVIGNDVSGYVIEIVEPRDFADIVKLLPNEDDLKLVGLITDQTESSFDKAFQKSKDCPRDWSDKVTKMFTVSELTGYGVPSASTVLVNEKNDDCIVADQNRLFYWQWRSDIFDEILEPRTLKGIFKYLSDGISLCTKPLGPSIIFPD